MSRVGSQRVTIVDVAREAGVAISSASAALNGRPGVSESTREQVQAVATRLGYVPSVRGRSLSAKRAFLVGLVVERDFDIIESDPFFGGFIGGIEESLAPRGYALALQIAQDEASSAARHIEFVETRRVDGLFLNEIRVDDARIEPLRDRKTAVVGINPDRGGFPFPAVRQDSSAAIREVVSLLRGLGHTRIAHVAGPPRYVHSRRRLLEWRGAMAEVGLAADAVVDGSFTHEGGLAAADLLLTGTERPTAVFCANDLSAVGFLNRAWELGLRVPEDVSVAGFDGISVGMYVRPALTTICTSPHALGREAARLLLAQIDGNPVADCDIEPAHLELRGSVTRAPN